MSSFTKLLKFYAKDQNGVAAVEFGMVAVIFLTLAFGIMEAAHAMWVYNGVEYATQRASRAALVDTDLSDADLEDLARSELTAMSISASEFTLSTADIEQSGVEFKEITATYDYHAFVTAFLPQSLRHFTMQTTVSRPVNWEN